MGRGEKNSTVYIIDFGLAELSTVEKQQSSIQSKKGIFRGAFSARSDHEEENDDLIKGTLPFCSVSAMKGSFTYEKDDLESLSYSLLYMLDNKLPWSTTKELSANSDVSAMIRDILTQKVAFQSSIQKEDGNSNSRARAVIHKLLQHSTELEMTTKPDYQYLSMLVQEALREEIYESSAKNIFEWEMEGQRAVWENGPEIELLWD